MSETKAVPSSHSGQLLHTKLMPPRLPVTAIPRAALLARLDQGLSKKAILVSAPTGFGKTTLIRQWIQGRQKAEGGMRKEKRPHPSSFTLHPFPFAWVTLDEYDNDPVRFWTYVCSALRTVDPSLGKATLARLASPQPPARESLLTPLLNDLARLEKSFVLVLEDYHAIKSGEVNEGVSFLLQHLSESLHLVFITRSEPELPLGILRARDELVEIGAEDLRFSQAEAEAFLQGTLPTPLAPSTVANLLQKTEGWPAGLRLVTLASQNKRGAAEIGKLVESFSGSDRYVADYLIHEVFQNQPEETQSFLLRTSFLRRLTGSLCDAILETSHSAAVLEQLERDNLFLVQLERTGEQTWYRYNPLFAEALQYLARQRLGPASLRGLFEKASDWYEYHGLFDEAIEMALTATLFERAMTLIEKFIEIHDLSEFRTLARWLAQVPQPEVLRHPAICFTYAQVLLYSTDRFAPATAARLEPFLQAAESAWRSAGASQRLGQLLSFRGNVTWWQGELPKAFTYARQALEILPEHDVFWRGNSLLSLGYEALSAGQIQEAQDKVLEARALLGAAQNQYGVLAATQFLAEIFYWQGELESAEQLNRQIQSEAVGDESMLDDQGIAALNLAQIAYERNDLPAAEEFALHALALARQRANEMLQVGATLRLAYLQSARSEAGGGRDLLKSLEAKIQNPNLLREIQHAKAWIALRAGEAASLDWWVNLVSAENENVLPLQKEREAFTLARLRIAQGRLEEAHRLLAPWRAEAAQQGRVRSQVEALCLEALAYYADTSLPDAARAMEEALALGQAKGFRRLFLDQGPRLAALLQATLSNRSPSTMLRTSLNLFAAALLHSFSPEGSSLATAAGSPVPVEALSQQELRVLRLLAAGLSNTDIARELVVSTNTVKSHVKSVYRKLNVNSRSEARDVARELKLL